jgi:RNA polymerase sigma-70 factor, ECF subfamily
VPRYLGSNPFSQSYRRMENNGAHDRPLQYVADDPDLPLVQEIRNGNTSAFEELVKRYDRRLYRIAQNIVHNHEDAQDVVQEALFRAFTKLTLFQGKSKFSTWLIRIVLNQALMKTRRVRRTFVSIDHNSYEGEEHVPREIVDWAPNPEAAYRNSELRTILQLSLRKLGQRLRAVFVLRDIEGLSIEEAADALDLTPATVKTRTLRARLRLREELSRYFNRRDRPSQGLNESAIMPASSDARLRQVAAVDLA